ncbi:MAG: phage holin family protein [Pseudomonadota bacterium]
MLEGKQSGGSQLDAADPVVPVGEAALPDNTSDDGEQTPDEPVFDESLTDEIAALIDGGRTYATAEIEFQKTRAALAGRSVGFAAGFVVLALILLHIALLALAVGLVMALEPLVTIWGAIAIVVGVLLLGVGLLVHRAAAHGKLLGKLFSDTEADRSDSA